MLYKVTWGIKIYETKGFGRCDRPLGKCRESKQFGQIDFEEDDLTTAKRKAVRFVKVQPEVQVLFTGNLKTHSHWKAWEPNVGGIDSRDESGNPITHVSRLSERIHGVRTPIGTCLVAYINISWERLERE